MKTPITNHRGIGAAQPFKSATPISLHRERGVPMNRLTRCIIVSQAVNRSSFGTTTAVPKAKRLQLTHLFTLLKCCTALALVGSAFPTSVPAASTVIGFDDLPAGTQVHTQYHDSGVDLDSRSFLNLPVV